MDQDKQQLFKDWDGVTKFYVWDASYLWIEVDPNDDTACKDFNNRFQPIKRMMVENIKQGKLIAYYSLSGNTYSHSDFLEKFPVGTLQRRLLDWNRIFMDRKDLKLFAEEINEAPLFLFAEKRSALVDDNPSTEEYISSLKIWCENDIEIVIQEPGKKARRFSNEIVGCARSDTLEWRTLLKIIRSPSLNFNYGDSPDSEKKLFQRIEGKLKALLVKEFGVKFLDGFKLYSPLGSGQFKLKFKSEQYEEPSEEIFANYSTDQLKEELRLRSKSCSPADLIGITCELQKRDVPNSELENIIQFDSTAGLDQIEYEPYENEQ